MHVYNNNKVTNQSCFPDMSGQMPHEGEFMIVQWCALPCLPAYLPAVSARAIFFFPLDM